MLAGAPAARLGDADYRAVLDFVGDINDAQDLADLRTMVLGSLRRMVPADYSSYNEIPAGPGEHVAIVEPELPQSAHVAWERLAHTNPLVQHYGRTRDGRPYRFSDVVDRAALHRLEIYRELYAPYGIEHQIAFVLPSPPDLTIGVTLNRSGPADFDDRERAMLDLARPHMIQAYRNAQLRGRTASLLGALRGGLDARGDAALVVDGAGRLVLATAEGERLAALASAAPLRSDRPLPDPLACALSAAGRVTSLPALAGADALLVTRVPQPDGGAVLFLEPASAALTPATLRGLGLTEREAEVLAALARGLSTADAAAQLGIASRTLLKHAERIHRRLGVRDRAQAVATAWMASGAARDRVAA